MLTTPSPLRSTGELAGTLCPNCCVMRTRSRILTLPSLFTSPVASCSSTVMRICWRFVWGCESPVIAANSKFSSISSVSPDDFALNDHLKHGAGAGHTLSGQAYSTESPNFTCCVINTPTLKEGVSTVCFEEIAFAHVNGFKGGRDQRQYQTASLPNSGTFSARISKVKVSPK